MTDWRLHPRGFDAAGLSDGVYVVNVASGKVTGFVAPPVSGVTTIVAGNNIHVDATDPHNPIVSASELLMADGVTSPPVPIETEAGDDWLYQD